MPKSRNVTLEMESNYRSCHHRKLGMLLGHLVNGSVGSLNRKLHQIFNISAILLVSKCFLENFDRSLGCDLTSFCTTDAISHREDRSFAVVQNCVLIQRTTLV